MKLYKRGDVWYVDGREQGVGRVSTGTTDQLDAIRRAERILARRGRYRHTLAEALDKAWKEHYADTKGAVNVYSQIQVLKKVAGETLLEDIDTPWQYELTKHMRENRGIGSATINRYMALLNKVLKLCVVWGWLKAKPMAVPKAKEAQGRIRVLSDGEELQVLGYFNDTREWMLNLVAFLLDTGARLGEALSISAEAQREAIATGKWTISTSKNGKRRTIPLTERALMALKIGGWRGMSSWKVQHEWQEMKRQLGYVNDEEFVIHALRHTCASRLVSRGANLLAVKEYLGHSSIKTTERYAHLDTGALDGLSGLL